MRRRPLFFQLDLLNPGHESCKAHQQYILSCGQYEVLLDRARGCCEICGKPGFLNDKRKKLYIDHDEGFGYWGVRGLLCSTCNTGLPKNHTRAAYDYQNNAFFRWMFDRLSLPLEVAEPPIGSTVVDVKGVLWTRKKERWDKGPGGFVGRRFSSWHWLHYRNGPQILAPQVARLMAKAKI